MSYSVLTEKTTLARKVVFSAIKIGWRLFLQRRPPGDKRSNPAVGNRPASHQQNKQSYLPD